MKITSYTENLPSHDNFIFKNEFYNNDIGIILLTTFKNPLCYTRNNSITDNIFLKNKVGIELHSSDGNRLINNKFLGNIISAAFWNCKQNYWNRSRLLPKPIIGFKNSW